MTSVVCAEESAYRELRQRLVDGRLPPGARLVHRALAAELGMSPVPLVLALRALERDGLVVNTPGLGARVRIWLRDEIVDVFHIRASQESLACRLCAQRASPADLGIIAAGFEAFKESFRKRDDDRNVAADLEFHRSIVRGSHSADLERIIRSLPLMDVSMTVFSIALRVPRLYSDHLEAVHDSIFEAIRIKDPAAAEHAGRRHVEESLERNLRWLEKAE